MSPKISMYCTHLKILTQSFYSDLISESTKLEEKINVEEDTESDIFGQTEDTRNSNDVHVLSENKFSDKPSGEKNILTGIGSNEINFDSDMSIIEENDFENKCMTDPAYLEKVIAASKVGFFVVY